jgi:hypothetical protein
LRRLMSGWQLGGSVWEAGTCAKSAAHSATARHRRHVLSTSSPSSRLFPTPGTASPGPPPPALVTA